MVGRVGGRLLQDVHDARRGRQVWIADARARSRRRPPSSSPGPCDRSRRTGTAESCPGAWRPGAPSCSCGLPHVVEDSGQRIGLDLEPSDARVAPPPSQLPSRIPRFERAIASGSSSRVRSPLMCTSAVGVSDSGQHRARSRERRPRAPTASRRRALARPAAGCAPRACGR